MRTVAKRIRSNSFAARITAAQREELLAALDGGLRYEEAAVIIRGWMQANAEAKLPGVPAVRPVTLTSISPISRWYAAAVRARQREQQEIEALTAEAQGSDGAQSGYMLLQARYQALMKGHKPADIAAFERNELARQKFELEKEKLAYQRRRDSVLEETKALLERATWDKGADLQHQIKLALEEIEKMRLGED